MPLQPDNPQQAQAWVRGAPPEAIVDFYIPRGNQGLPGPRGPQGPSVGVGNVVTSTDPDDAGENLDAANVKVVKNLDELDFTFYVPANTTQSKNFAIAMAIAL